MGFSFPIELLVRDLRSPPYPVSATVPLVENCRGSSLKAVTSRLSTAVKDVFPGEHVSLTDRKNKPDCRAGDRQRTGSTQPSSLPPRLTERRRCPGSPSRPRDPHARPAPRAECLPLIRPGHQGKTSSRSRQVTGPGALRWRGQDKRRRAGNFIVSRPWRVSTNLVAPGDSIPRDAHQFGRTLTRGMDDIDSEAGTGALDINPSGLCSSTDYSQSYSRLQVLSFRAVSRDVLINDLLNTSFSRYPGDPSVSSPPIPFAVSHSSLQTFLVLILPFSDP